MKTKKKKVAKRVYRPRAKPAKARQVQIRLTDDEFASLCAASDRAQLTVSDIVRGALRTAGFLYDLKD